MRPKRCRMSIGFFRLAVWWERNHRLDLQDARLVRRCNRFIGLRQAARLPARGLYTILHHVRSNRRRAAFSAV